MAAEAQWEPITLRPSMVCDGEMPLQTTSEARLDRAVWVSQCHQVPGALHCQDDIVYDDGRQPDI